ncbi:MAG: transposase [Candidatus Electrothrix sp. MAN1_4]|nr:transposase [Candidatus Electrothrix sp. MAN1_4]
MWRARSLRRKKRGLEKGMEKGMTKGIAQSLLTVLAAKFGVLPDTVRERVEDADCGQLEQWMDRVFAAECLEDVFQC